MKHVLILAVLFSAVACGGQPSIKEANTATPVLKTVWHKQLVGKKYFDKQAQEFAPVGVSKSTDEIVAATSAGRVVKFQGSNGEEKWSRTFDVSFHAGAEIGGGSVYVASLDGTLAALNLWDGSTEWEVTLPASLETQPTFSDGRLFLQDVNNTLYAIDARTGETLWTHRRDVPKFFTIKGGCQPLVTKDEVYCGFSDGHFMAFQIDSGDVLFDVNLTDGETEFIDVDGQPILENGTLYVASYSGGIYALDSFDGSVKWHKKTNGIGDLAERGPALYVTLANKSMARLTKDDGTVLWQYKFNDNTPLSVTPVGDYLLSPTSSGMIYVTDAETGYLHQRVSGSQGMHAPTVFASGRIYGISDGGRLTTFEIGW